MPVVTAGASRTLSGLGLATPESILHDAEADVYLISNINGPAFRVNGPLVGHRQHHIGLFL